MIRPLPCARFEYFRYICSAPKEKRMKRQFLIYAFIAAIFCLLPDFGAAGKKNIEQDFSSGIIYEEQTVTTLSASDSDICVPRPTNYSAPLRSNAQAKRVSSDNVQPLVLIIAGKHTCITNFKSYLSSCISCISGILRPENHFICLRKLII